MIGIILACMLIGGLTGFVIDRHWFAVNNSHVGVLFRNEESMIVPTVVLTIVFVLLYTFKTPLGPAIFSLISDGGAGTLVIFGGPVPLPIIGALACFFPIILLGAASALIVLCLVDIVYIAILERRFRR